VTSVRKVVARRRRAGRNVNLVRINGAARDCGLMASSVHNVRGCSTAVNGHRFTRQLDDRHSSSSSSRRGTVTAVVERSTTVAE